MFGDKENIGFSGTSSLTSTPGLGNVTSPAPSGLKNTPIRSLAASYKAARSENEVNIFVLIFRPLILLKDKLQIIVVNNLYPNIAMSKSQQLFRVKIIPIFTTHLFTSSLEDNHLPLHVTKWIKILDKLTTK
ncbi:hypothetical protein DPMN_018361 [Dreissena polymorpha]|uniref:Uncharacterized protein n=1 Tax=Dreissena polymorpha TaxID=45954 RepID=A0A9D4NI90_DREPO|nr:hypothetical protein DPMN_018361 [Dreissena polymorpha]